MTKIQWTDETWNPVRGCTRISDGCVNCYAERMAHRFSGPGQPYEGLTTIRNGRPGWTGEVRFVPEMLAAPLKWRKPRRVFVNSMSDLFHESLTNAQIAAVFGVMAECPQHQFQILTKRARRMREWFEWASGNWRPCGSYDRPAWRGKRASRIDTPIPGLSWPIPNVWLGVSVENQKAADERIPELLRTPAAVRFVSAEPLLAPVELQYGRGWLEPFKDTDASLRRTPRLDWVIVGGESGPGARPCNVDWIRSIVEQCRDAHAPAFVKQMGSNALEDGTFLPRVKHHKGGDPEEWARDLRVREYPGKVWDA